MLHQLPMDRIFHALADPTRLAMVDRLARGPATVTELAAPFDVTLTSIGQHLKLLESTGLVRTRKEGRVRTVELASERMAEIEAWFREHRARWERRLDALGDLLADETDDEDAP